MITRHCGVRGCRYCFEAPPNSIDVIPKEINIYAGEPPLPGVSDVAEGTLRGSPAQMFIYLGITSTEFGGASKQYR
jgi:hypothetical protein